jgi:amidohydrolase
MQIIKDVITPDSESRDLGGVVEKHCPRLEPYEDIYKDIHRNPELGTQEERTSGIVVQHLRDLDAGFRIHERIGGHGVVGVLENGPGPTVLLRADMDALPIREKTGLPYASSVTRVDPSGVERPAMHACGHDVHTTSLLAVAQLLSNARSCWRGTLVCLFQPDEEHGAGARAMVADRLYDKVPVPDVVLGQHVCPLKAGVVAIRPGTVLTSADSFDVRIFGRGGHGSQPQTTIDPVVTASYIIVRLQSVVSREVPPNEVAVLTCGSIHGGDTENVIPDHVDLKLNIRAYNPIVRDRVLAAVKRIIHAECAAAGTPQPPTITPTTHFPATENSPAVVDALRETWTTHLGARNVCDSGEKTASEDFSELARPFGTPYAFWNIGCIAPETWDDAEKHGKLADLPNMHSATFAPAIQPTLKTAVYALALAALTFLGPPGRKSKGKE